VPSPDPFGPVELGVVPGTELGVDPPGTIDPVGRVPSAAPDPWPGSSSAEQPPAATVRSSAATTAATRVRPRRR
jgi:hypothetical protein